MTELLDAIIMIFNGRELPELVSTSAENVACKFNKRALVWGLEIRMSVDEARDVAYLFREVMDINV